MKKLFLKYKHGLWLLYVFFYFPCFSYLEKTVTTQFHEIHMSVDDLIPFCEYFIIPYYLWFLFVIIAVIYFFFRDASEFNRFCIFLGVGMTLFLFISAIYPNGHYLRPENFPRDNVFTDLVRLLYESDTPTNLFPSIHVYNSVAVMLAVLYSRYLKKRPVIRWGSVVLTILIILSTLFLKQHSLFDVLTAFLLAFVMWGLIYSPCAVKLAGKKPVGDNKAQQI
ncbi:PAP2 superfamily [uncultured Roseburia sp.]|uniref:Phosphatase PAP2 family protein n=1 Tax=Brotonthovivens ammoniilytica TaxID=2981725 RepID=A0ABT2TLM6_9FIRM|nr:phosphatase PAP2 family protein [Brotonthovivens ammoniilytica]MCU6763115.1 phosphatase PAP2 family protein [Brotonthovivens ammoniilytica]SCJ03689.1 PAP2 superfamily [uncultured Roseburia sp.]